MIEDVEQGVNFGGTLSEAIPGETSVLLVPFYLEISPIFTPVSQRILNKTCNDS